MLLFLSLIVRCLCCVRIGRHTSVWKCLLLRYVTSRQCQQLNIFPLRYPNWSKHFIQTDSKLPLPIYLSETNWKPRYCFRLTVIHTRRICTKHMTWTENVMPFHTSRIRTKYITPTDNGMPFHTNVILTKYMTHRICTKYTTD